MRLHWFFLQTQRLSDTGTSAFFVELYDLNIILQNFKILYINIQSWKLDRTAPLPYQNMRYFFFKFTIIKISETIMSQIRNFAC